MPYQKFEFQAGIYKDNSPLTAEGYWTDGDKVRFDGGLPETIYGWERATTTLLTGVARGAMSWADSGRNPYAAFGTEQRLYAMDLDGNVTDTTPVISRGTLTNPFTTTNGTATTVTFNSHGLVAGQLFGVTSQSAAVGGITLSGNYAVVSVTDANNFVITTATATAAGPGGGTVYYSTSLAPGQVDGLGGLGYGTGGYGSGGYASASSGLTLFPRTWSFGAWGQNLIANPRNGGIYEWAPNTTATELVTDTTMATGWVAGTGWTIAAGTATSSVSVTGLTTTILCIPGAWHLLQFTMTRSAGTVQASISSPTATNIGSAYNDASKHQFVVFFSGAATQTLAFTGASFTGTVTVPSVKVLTVGNILTNAPTQCTSAFVTAERILVACGVPKDLSGRFDGAFDPLRLAWSDRADGTSTNAPANQTWTPGTANLAGAVNAAKGSRIVRGLPGNRENVILTDTTLYALRWVPDQNVVYAIYEVADGCGLIGPNAVCSMGGSFFWYSNNGEFYRYDGSYPQPLSCPVKRYVKDNLAWVQQDKIYCWAISGRNEIWWAYPDSRDGTEVSRYVIYNTVEHTWSVGTFDRTSWLDAGIFQYPLASQYVASTGLSQIWFHEKGFTQDGAARSWSIKSAYFDVEDGGKQMIVRDIQPDASGVQGNYMIELDFNIRNSSGVVARTFGPYTANASTGNIGARANGEECAVTYSGNGAPTFWRHGAMRMNVVPTGRTR